MRDIEPARERLRRAVEVQKMAGKFTDIGFGATQAEKYVGFCLSWLCDELDRLDSMRGRVE